MRMTTTLHATLTPEKTSSFSIAPGATTVTPRSPWHSPVPYLFGGLAAMLGLIAFALFILACSYWRLSRDNDPQQQSNEGGDLESGEKGEGVSKINGAPVFEEKIVVIMAGNDKPTFLATPALMLMSKRTLTIAIVPGKLLKRFLSTASNSYIHEILKIN
uniref:Uncharacterized protein n=1 Tax=Chenopodium quinoa TaxID=63459 RepID=A0A803LXV3_CHEQI